MKTNKNQSNSGGEVEEEKQVGYAEFKVLFVRPTYIVIDRNGFNEWIPGIFNLSPGDYFKIKL